MVMNIILVLVVMKFISLTLKLGENLTSTQMTVTVTPIPEVGPAG